MAEQQFISRIEWSDEAIETIAALFLDLAAAESPEADPAASRNKKRSRPSVSGPPVFDHMIERMQADVTARCESDNIESAE